MPVLGGGSIVKEIWRWIARVVACAGLALPTARAAEPELWSLSPVVRPGVPSGASTTSNPIDAFLASEYRAKGLEPAGPADKQTLLRRVTLDLTGLPPTPAEQEAFLRDESPSAYESVVDRLLAGEQHGVRFGRRIAEGGCHTSRRERGLLFYNIALANRPAF